MAFRSDISIDWIQSPRIITVAAPSTELTMQDLHDTMRELEDDIVNLSFPKIISSGGKERLDAVTRVTITSTLLNAKVGFEARTDWTQCSITGGNLVAVDENGNDMSPINPTAFVNIDRASSSSGTLQEQEALQYASYGGQVSLNRDTNYSGVEYPVGNQEYNVNNASDAVSICHTKGFHTIGISSNYDFVDGDVIDGLKIRGISHVTTIVTIAPEADCTKVILDNLDVTGTLDGDSEIIDSVVRDLVFFNGHIHHSALAGTILLGGGKPAKITECSMLEFSSPVIIDAGGSGQNAVIDNYTGKIIVNNITGSSMIGISLNGGMVEITSSCISGTIVIQGNYEITDNSGDGCTVIQNEKILVLSDIPTIAEAVMRYER